MFLIENECKTPYTFLHSCSIKNIVYDKNWLNSFLFWCDDISVFSVKFLQECF